MADPKPTKTAAAKAETPETISVPFALTVSDGGKDYRVPGGIRLRIVESSPLPVDVVSKTITARAAATLKSAVASLQSGALRATPTNGTPA